jgi:hypothetical protein
MLFSTSNSSNCGSIAAITTVSRSWVSDQIRLLAKPICILPDFIARYVAAISLRIPDNVEMSALPGGRPRLFGSDCNGLDLLNSLIPLLSCRLCRIYLMPQRFDFRNCHSDAFRGVVVAALGCRLFVQVFQILKDISHQAAPFRLMGPI